MTTILILNAASSLVAALGIGGAAVRARRRRASVQPLYARVPRG